MNENKKNNKGCGLIAAVLVLLAGAGLFMLGRYMKHAAEDFSKEETSLQNRLDTLPVLETDGEISAAIMGEPKNYLIKNYVFKNSPTIKDTVLNVLNGEYLCVYVVEETLTYFLKSMFKAGESPYYSMWVEKPYCQISAPLCFNNGVKISKPDSLTFLFSLWDRSKRIFEDEINPEKRENFSINSRYYPDRNVNESDPEKVIKDIFTSFGNNAEELAKRFGEDGIKFESRYNFTYMSRDDKATFAVRLGGGKADFNVFEGKNVIIVGGDKISTATQENLMGKVWSVFGIVIMVLAVIIVLSAAVYLLSTLKTKKE